MATLSWGDIVRPVSMVFTPLKNIRLLVIFEGLGILLVEFLVSETLTTLDINGLGHKEDDDEDEDEEFFMEDELRREACNMVFWRTGFIFRWNS